MHTIEAGQDRAGAVSVGSMDPVPASVPDSVPGSVSESVPVSVRESPRGSGRPLRPAAASTLAPSWLQQDPAPAEVAAVFDQAVYLRRGQDVLPLLAPDALLLPGALRVATRADLDALRVRVGAEVLVGRGEVRTPGGGLVVRRVWRPQPVPSAALTGPARQAARAALPAVSELEPQGGPAAVSAARLAELAAAAVDGSTEGVHGLVGLGPGLTPAGDDVLCGLLLGLRASGQDRERSRLTDAVLPRLAGTTALSATLLRHAAQGYAVPPVVALLRAWHRGAGVAALALAARPVAAIGHTSGPALVLGLAAALAAPHTSPGPSGPSHEGAGHRPARRYPDRTHPVRTHPQPVGTPTGATRGTS